MRFASQGRVSLRPPITKLSASEPWFHSWPQDDQHTVVHLRPEPAGIDEFSSEQPYPAAAVPVRGEASVWNDWARDEWAFRIVTTIAVLEAVILIAAGISLSGILRTATGTILVDSVPAAAEVRVDGSVAGLTPLSITAEAGRRTIEVRHQQHTQTLTLTVVRGETSHGLVQFAAPAQSRVDASAEIQITSEPAAAQVAIDGVMRGATPVVVPDLTPGSHAVSVRGISGQVNRSIEVAAGRPQTLHVLLPASSASPARPARPADPGWISVGVPTALRVFEGGRFVGATGAGPIALSPGVHDLEFVNEGLGLRLRQRVSVQSDLTTTVTPSLPRGSLAITAEPWAAVWVNDERVGETPVGNLSLPVGQYEVLLRHPEFGERRTRVRVTADAVARVNVDLRPRPETP